MSTSPPDLSDFTPDTSDFTPDAAPALDSHRLAMRQGHATYTGGPIAKQPVSPYEAIGAGIKDLVPTPRGIAQTEDAIVDMIKSAATGRYGKISAQSLGVPEGSPVQGGHIKQFFSALGQSFYPSQESQFPGYRAAGRVLGTAATMAAGGPEGQNQGRVQNRVAPPTPETGLTAALRSSPKVNVMKVAPEALPALREAAGYLDVNPESLQGQRGVQQVGNILNHALDVHESRFKQLIGPVQNEMVTKQMLSKYPDLADYLGVEDKAATINDINAARTTKANQFFSKSASAQQGATGALLDAKKIQNQARDFLYDYIQQRTGVDPGPLKRAQSALLTLKPIVERSISDTLKAEADYQLNPPEQKSANIFRTLVTAAKAKAGNPTAALDLIDQIRAKTAGAPMSPAEMFNKSMRLALQGSPRGGPPAAGAADVIGGPQEFQPAPTQFGGGTNTTFYTNNPQPYPRAGNPMTPEEFRERVGAINDPFTSMRGQGNTMPVGPSLDPELARHEANMRIRAQEASQNPAQTTLFNAQPQTTDVSNVPAVTRYYDKYGRVIEE